MNPEQTTTQIPLPISSSEWDSLRDYLRNTVIVKTSLGSLAKNVGLKWPIRGKGETPERYIRYSLEELADLPEFFGKGNRLSLLYSILLETKQLDDPFADMTQHLEAESVAEEAVRTSPLEHLDIPAEFPVELVNFSERSLNLCRDGGYATLAQLVEFLEKSGSAAMINEEFKLFRNGLRTFNRTTLKQFLPIREGSNGIFLAESLGQLGQRLFPPQAATLVHAFRISTTNIAWNEDAVLPRSEALALISEVRQSAQKCFDLMPDQAQQLRSAVEAGVNSTVRFFVTLDDPELEALAMAIAMAALDVKPRFKGLIGRILN